MKGKFYNLGRGFLQKRNEFFNSLSKFFLRISGRSPFSLGAGFIETIDLESLYHAAPAGDVLVDKEGIIRHYNKTFGHIFLKNNNTIIGESFTSIVALEDREKVGRHFQKCFNGEDLRYPVEFSFIWGEEAVIFTGVFEYAEPNDDFKKEKGIFVQVFDNKEQKNVQLRLIQSQKTQAMGQLAGGIAHDFNNLLTAMIGYCDLLLLRHSPNEESFTDIMQIKQNANRAANLVRQLLAFSSQQTLQPKVIDVTETLTDLSVLLQRLVGASIGLKLYHGRDLGFIRVDQGQFEQVIINLVVNARDAIGESGDILIRTENRLLEKPLNLGHDTILPGPYTVIEVIDTGCGIDPKNINRIFDPFFTTKEVGSGTGLGLATVQGIINQTGGYIKVSSHKKTGTCFSIFLPKYSGDLVPAFQSTEKTMFDGRDLTGSETILIVEDEDAVRLFSARALRNKGYQVIEAKNGEEGLALLQETLKSGEKKIDLLITDIVMPIIDGPTLVKKAHEKMPDLKVIYMSGYAEDSFRRRLQKNEAIFFVSKPFSLKGLAEKVKEVLGTSEKEKMRKLS